MKHYKMYLVILIILISLLTLFLPFGGNFPNLEILLQLRLPRLIFALVGGSFISVSALIFQVTLRNNYVDATMLGISSGAELFNAFIVIILVQTLPFRVLTGAFFAIIWLLILRATMLKFLQQPLFLLLGGLAMAMFLNALTSLITNNQGFFGKSLSNVTMQDAWLILIIAIIGIMAIQTFGNNLQYFALPKMHILQLGINENKIALPWQIIAAVFSGSVSSVLGSTFFVGLILAQLIIFVNQGSASKRILPTALLGAFMLSLSDLIAHGILYPVELSTSVILMLITTPFMLILWRKKDVN